LKKLFDIYQSNIVKSGQQILLIMVGDKHLCFAITGGNNENLHRLAYYTSEGINEHGLAELFRLHPELNDSFEKIKVCFDYPQYVIVPDIFFHSADAPLFLETLHGTNEKSIIQFNTIAAWQLHNVYVVPSEVVDWLGKKFPTASYLHLFTARIQQVNTEGNFWVDFGVDTFSLIALQENKLLLARSFPYSSPEDVIYYLLKTAQQFSFSTTDVRLMISGLIDKKSTLYKELYAYFLNIEFKNADWIFPENYTYPAHFFTSLNGIAKCVL
jgi:hypothetical protein